MWCENGAWTRLNNALLLQVGRQLKDCEGRDGRLLEPEAGWEDRDPDHLALLCKETIDLGKSVIIFCASKKVAQAPISVPPFSDISN